MSEYILHDPVRFVCADDSGCTFLDGGNGIGHREGLVCQLEHSQVVYLIAKDDQATVFQTLQALETQNGLRFGGPGILNGQPVPARRRQILMALGLDPPSVPPVHFAGQFLQFRSPSDYGETDDLVLQPALQVV